MQNLMISMRIRQCVKMGDNRGRYEAVFFFLITVRLSAPRDFLYLPWSQTVTCIKSWGRESTDRHSETSMVL
jgi:hypothetical protein